MGKMGAQLIRPSRLVAMSLCVAGRKTPTNRTITVVADAVQMFHSPVAPLCQNIELVSTVLDYKHNCNSQICFITYIIHYAIWREKKPIDTL